jgi:hypothetical protein
MGDAITAGAEVRMIWNFLPKDICQFLGTFFGCPNSAMVVTTGFEWIQPRGAAKHPTRQWTLAPPLIWSKCQLDQD